MRRDSLRVRALIREGADVNAAQGDGMTALHWAAMHGDASQARMLIAAGARLDAVTRKLPGVISNPDSVVSESHAPELQGGAEYPHYTRPAEFRGWEVPEVLRSGHHAEIARWRAEQVRKR